MHFPVYNVAECRNDSSCMHEIQNLSQIYVNFRKTNIFSLAAAVVVPIDKKMESFLKSVQLFGLKRTHKKHSTRQEQQHHHHLFYVYS